jgi:hemerythrin
MIIEWTADLVSGNKNIDNQHMKLFENTNKLYEAVDKGEEDAITNILEYLEDYVIVHFRDEEKYMKKVGYEGYAKHKKIHEEFRIEVSKRIKDYKNTGYDVDTIRSTQKFISQWLYNHVLKVDLQMIKNINSKK